MLPHIKYTKQNKTKHRDLKYNFKCHSCESDMKAGITQGRIYREKGIENNHS